MQAQLSVSPLWVLDMFAPPARADAPDTDADDGGGEAAGRRGGGAGRLGGAPRSLNEIYKLSNLNKRRGAGAGKKAAAGGGEGGGDSGHEPGRGYPRLSRD